MQFHDGRDQAVVGRPLTLLRYYSPTLKLHTMHAPDLLSFADLFHHQREIGGDSAQDVGCENDLIRAAQLRSRTISPIQSPTYHHVLLWSPWTSW